MDGEDEPPVVFGWHLLLCRTLEEHPDDPDASFTLGHVIVQVRPTELGGFPFVVQRLRAYVQLLGTPGEYTVRIRQVPVAVDEDGDEVTGEAVDHGPWDIFLPGEEYAQPFGFLLYDLEFAAPGVYEFQFWADGIDGPIVSERILAKE